MGSPDGGAGTTAADYATLDTVKNRFNDLGAAFRNSKTPLGQSYDRALAAAGQFAPQLQPGAVKFMLAWRETFEVCDDCACLIAGNIGKTAVDLKAVDIDGDLTITL